MCWPLISLKDIVLVAEFLPQRKIYRLLFQWPFEMIVQRYIPLNREAGDGTKRGWLHGTNLLTYMGVIKDYIIPIPPPPPPGIIGGAGSGISTMAHSVVRNMPAMEAAFSRAIRATLVGSITPDSNRFSNFSV
jgi:hypothetical protein